MDETPRQFILERDALAKAFKEHLDGLLTEPMPLWKIGDLMDINRKTAATIVRNIEGAVRVGKLWRIPLKMMPPRYHLEAGLLPSE